MYEFEIKTLFFLTIRRKQWLAVRVQEHEISHSIYRHPRKVVGSLTLTGRSRSTEMTRAHIMAVKLKDKASMLWSSAFELTQTVPFNWWYRTKLFFVPITFFTLNKKMPFQVPAFFKKNNAYGTRLLVLLIL